MTKSKYERNLSKVSKDAKPYSKSRDYKTSIFSSLKDQVQLNVLNV